MAPSEPAASSDRGLHPRHRIDVEPDALALALARCARPDRHAAPSLERWTDPGGEVLATLSVRSGFDALLSALALPAGSEVLLSAWTIPDMARVVRAHGLVPVPLDCEPGTLAPAVDTLSRAISARSRVLVVAQLFGGTHRLRALAALARAAGMLVVDDDAQGFTGRERLAGSDCADVVFHSFGSLKTATALGGGLVRVRHAALRERMRALMARWPAQPTGRYARKVATFLALAGVRDPGRYGAFARAAESAGRDFDGVVTGVTRGFAAETPDALLRALRHRPCDTLCETLLEGLQRHAPGRIARRREAGERMQAQLGAGVTVLGSAMEARTHWLFAVLARGADGLVRALRREGYDAARATSTMAALPTAPERPEQVATECAGWRSGVVFLPAYPEVPEAARDRMAELVRAWSEER